MAIQVICPITGAKFTMSAFKTKVDAYSRHPALALSLAELNSITIGVSESDNFLLMAGYLAQLERLQVLKFRAPLNRNAYSGRWLQQYLPKLTSLVNWIALNEKSKIRQRIPHFAVQADTGPLPLQSWTAEALQIIDNLSFAWTVSAKAANSKSSFLKLIESTVEHGESYHEPEAKRKVPVAVQARSFAKYVQRSFELSGMMPQVYQQVRSVVMRPAEYPPSTLRKVRALIMELGLETTIADVNDKELICAAIDKVLIEKCGILSMLDAATQDDLDDIETIRAGYTILIDGNAHINSAVPAAKADAELRNASVVPTLILGPEPEVSATEPKPEDYANRALYLAAHSRWKRAQRN